MNRLVAAFLVLFLVSACQKEENVVPIQTSTSLPISTNSNAFVGVDEALWPYFQRFEEEGLKRGISVNIRQLGITGEIKKIGEDQVAGQCSYASHQPNHVTIDLEFWNRTSDLYREFVVFHELGHCYLLRDHREDATPAGNCISLMRSGLGDCRDNYHAGTRQAYFDELFDSDQF